jgi:hypothetical protein
MIPAASGRGIMNVLAHASSLLRRKQRGIYPQVIQLERYGFREDLIQGDNPMLNGIFG